MKTIGWKEKVDFPEFGIKNVDAKTDTGARTSVLHCSKIELVKRNRKNYVKFIPLSEGMAGYNEKEFTLSYHKERKVKSSFGLEENRFIVKTTVSLFGETHEIEISLRDRSSMEFPVLLGRSFIRRRFLVDVSRSNLSHKSLHKRKAKK